jgi:hypothetical protein
MLRVARALALAALALPLMHCAGAEDDGAAADDQTQDELRGRGNERWVYNGPLPHLVSPSITVSLTAHTVRITGAIPGDWNGSVPFYAERTKEAGVTKLTVVYPIATGEEVNAQPATYGIDRVAPWAASNDKAPWGGFPFIPYKGGIAFHGPITKADNGDWKLIRGAVSHGCNRMQGEHVVELAHLIGVDMSTTIHGGNGFPVTQVPVTVLRQADTFEGKPVDVDYPALAGVQRPAGAKMFKAWDSNDFPALVCAFDKAHTVDGKIPANYCAGVRGLKNKKRLSGWF